MVMKPLMPAFCILFAMVAGGASAQTTAWQPALPQVQVPIWPAEPPDAQPAAAPEAVSPVKTLVGGKPWTEVTNVARPTMTLYSPQGKNTGVAVVVFPGGGFQILAIDLEGTEICDWLTSRGITCVLLKYRVPHSGPYWDDQCKCQLTPKAPTALEDVQRTMGLVRFHAAELHVDPNKIGVMGFSAGGYLVAAISTHFDHRLYAPVDAADKESCRPDFAVADYPGHLSLDAAIHELNPEIAQHITGQTPPTFLLQAENDPVDRVENSLVYFAALREARIPVEMHLYAQGGHGFGLRRTQLPITAWPQLVETWLHTIGMISD